MNISIIKKIKARLMTRSPSQNFMNGGRHVMHGFISGIQKSKIDTLKRIFEPYKLPLMRWTFNYAYSFKRDFESMKSFYE